MTTLLEWIRRDIPTTEVLARLQKWKSAGARLETMASDTMTDVIKQYNWLTWIFFALVLVDVVVPNLGKPFFLTRNFTAVYQYSVHYIYIILRIVLPLGLVLAFTLKNPKSIRRILITGFAAMAVRYLYDLCVAVFFTGNGAAYDISAVVSIIVAVCFLLILIYNITSPKMAKILLGLVIIGGLFTLWDVLSFINSTLPYIFVSPDAKPEPLSFNTWMIAIVALLDGIAWVALKILFALRLLKSRGGESR